MFELHITSEHPDFNLHLSLPAESAPGYVGCFRSVISSLVQVARIHDSENPIQFSIDTVPPEAAIELRYYKKWSERSR